MTTFAASLGAIAVVVGIVFGQLDDIKSAVAGIGYIGVLVILATIIVASSLVLVLRSLVDPWVRRGRRGVSRVYQVIVVVLSLLTFIGLIASSAIVVLYFAASPGSDGEAGPTPVGARQQPSQPPQPDIPFCSYLDKAGVRIVSDDIQINIRSGGFVRQEFRASSDQIGAVAVIIARQFQGIVFDTTEIGQVRLTLSRVDEQGGELERLPIVASDSSDPPTRMGVTQQAGPNNEDTLFELQPVSVIPGERYAITVYNEEPDVVLSFSIRPQGNGFPITWSGEVGDTVDETRTNRALAGYVCREVPP